MFPVNVPFTENNSVFAPDTWLFGFRSALDLFAAEDEVIDQCRPHCDVALPTTLSPANNATAPPPAIPTLPALSNMPKLSSMLWRNPCISFHSRDVAAWPRIGALQ